MSKALEKLGFRLARISRHMVYEHPDGRIVVIPNHPSEEIGPGLLSKILKQDLQMSREDFLKYV